MFYEIEEERKGEDQGKRTNLVEGQKCVEGERERMRENDGPMIRSGSLSCEARPFCALSS